VDPGVPEVAAGAAAVAAGVTGARLLPDLGATGTLFGFAVRAPDSGDGEITSICGNMVWADAIGGAMHNPTAIAEPATEERRPHRQISFLLIRFPLLRRSAYSSVTAVRPTRC
jgi:hypothetical protein